MSDLSVWRNLVTYLVVLTNNKVSDRAYKWKWLGWLDYVSRGIARLNTYCLRVTTFFHRPSGRHNSLNQFEGLVQHCCFVSRQSRKSSLIAFTPNLVLTDKRYFQNSLTTKHDGPGVNTIKVKTTYNFINGIVFIKLNIPIKI